jgi:hypothetical protein
MNDLIFRLLYLLRFLVFLAIVYLILHMLVVRWIKKPGSKVQGLFALLTSPLTHPVRVLLGPGTPESRVRLLTLAALIGVWLVVAALTARLGARLT